MSRVTSLTAIPEQQLDRWIKRIGLLLLVGVIAFVAFYAIDRYRPATAPIVDRELAALEGAVRDDPADVAARGRLADVYLAAKRYDDAIAQYTAIIGTGKDLELAYVSRGRAYELTANLDAAAADYAKVIEIARDAEMANVDSALETAHFGLGSIALQRGQAQLAVEELTKALAIKRTDADAINLLGSAYIQAGDLDKAITALSRAIALVPVGWSEPYTNLAQAYGKAGKASLAEWAAAMAQFQAGDAAGAEPRLLALAGGDAAVEASVGLGLVMESRGDSASAAEWYAKALGLDPDNVSAQLGLSRVRPVGAPSASPAAPAPSASEGSH